MNLQKFIIRKAGRLHKTKNKHSDLVHETKKFVDLWCSVPNGLQLLTNQSFTTKQKMARNLNPVFE